MQALFNLQKRVGFQCLRESLRNKILVCQKMENTDKIYIQINEKKYPDLKKRDI